MKNFVSLLAAACCTLCAGAGTWETGREDRHPAAASAGKMLAEAGVDAVLRIDPDLRGVVNDGYAVTRTNGTLTVTGKRPRSLLFAAGEWRRWKDVAEKPFVRDPHFASRGLGYGNSSHPLSEWIAATGCNFVQTGRDGTVTLEKSMPEVYARLSDGDRKSLSRWHKSSVARCEKAVRECADADVGAWQMLYGCDASKWSKPLLDAFLEVYPSARAVAPEKSWEKGVLCPSDPATWKFIGAYVAEIAQLAPFEGVIATFWDDYGLNCKCERCVASGLDGFPKQVAAIVSCYERSLSRIGKKLIVRTWSSGSPHWLHDEWVHAPGYAGAEDAMALWGPTFGQAMEGTVFQTKVYNCDCQPDAPFSNLLGKAKPQTEFAEWQITGQTVGRQWLPASVVDHTARTMRISAGLVGRSGGVFLYAGRYKNPGYEALDDIANSVNIYAWRQLSWNPQDDVETLWREWAEPLYGQDWQRAAGAMMASERIVVASFSPLGLGAPTESVFAKTVSRREDLLRYTNRHYLPEGKAALERTLGNVSRVIAEKDEAIALLDYAERAVRSMKRADPARVEELKTRFSWLREHLLCSKELDVSLWRCRFLQGDGVASSSRAEQIAAIEASRNVLRTEGKKLFACSPDSRMSFYPKPLGNYDIGLGSPIPLINDIVETAVGAGE